MYAASPFLPPPNDPRWVVVANLPREANEAWLRMLFSPVGLVELIEFAGSEGPGTACLLFATAEQAAASLRFNGFVALGIAMQVRPRNKALIVPTGLHHAPLLTRPDAPSVSPLSRFRSTPSAMDTKPTHKNLYVLNLPLDASTDQLTALFSSYGTVVHCVILAMLDAQARRRGFIDMSSSNEAKEAIEGLNGFVWHGYPIEVSYAIVQRSGGPFDQVTGRNIIKRNVPRNRFNTGPRRVPSDSSINVTLFGDGTTPTSHYGVSTFGSNLSGSGYSEGSGIATSEREDEASSATDPFTIFIAGLDPVAIIDDEDFRHALQPYGQITAATLCRDEHGTSRGFGIVTFSNQEEATNACDNINGKIINGRRLSAHKYVYQTHPSVVRANMQMLPGMSSNLTLPSRPSSLQRRGYPDANQANNGSFGSTLPYPSSTLLQQIPLLNARLAPRSSHLPAVWPTSPHGYGAFNVSNRLDQIPMGSIGSSLNDNWVSSSGSMQGATCNAASFFKANGASKPIEIKPDPKQMEEKQVLHEKNNQAFAKTLGEAFMPMPKSTGSSERYSDATVMNDCLALDRNSMENKEAKPNSVVSMPTYNAPPNAMALLRTPSSTTSLWNSSNGSCSNSIGLDALSPESTMSMTSSASSLSQLNTPEAVRGADSTTIWGQSASTDRINASIRSAVSPGSWLSNSPPSSNDKRVNINGSAILSLQNNDAVEKATNRGNNAMAPVGHEKTSSSPLRVLRPFKEDGEVDSAEC